MQCTIVTCALVGGKFLSYIKINTDACRGEEFRAHNLVGSTVSYLESAPVETNFMGIALRQTQDEPRPVCNKPLLFGQIETEITVAREEVREQRRGHRRSR